MLAPWKKSSDKPRQCKSFGKNLCQQSYVKAMVFLVVMYGCESWTVTEQLKKMMFLNCGVGEAS